MSKEMTIEQVEALQAKIAELTTECAETEGAIKQIKAQWKSEYKCDTKEEMEALQKETAERISMLQVKRETLTAKIQELLPEEILNAIIDDDEDEEDEDY